MTDQRTHDDDSLSVGYSVVAYLDLMGQRDMLRKLVRLPRTSEEQQDVIRILRDTALNVRNMREAFLHHFTPYEPFLLAQIPAKDRETCRQILARPTRHRGFSDSVVITVSLRSETTIDHVAGLIAVHRALLAVAAVQTNCLGTLGVSIRGGIDVGLGVEIFDHEYYGRALVEAYDLESREADYPRCLIGPGLIDYLDAMEQAVPSFEQSLGNVAQKFIEDSRSMFRRSPDDQKFAVDPFVVVTFEDGTGRAVELCRQAMSKTAELMTRFADGGNEKLARKYERLHRFLAASPYLPV